MIRAFAFISAYSFGVCLQSPDIPTDKLFTGQRLDQTGLYYYNARYYDPTIGRFISADTVIQNKANPQCFNRYSYCSNNPLKYVDPSGHVNWWIIGTGAFLVIVCVATGGVLLYAALPVLAAEIASGSIFLAIEGAIDIGFPCCMLTIGTATGCGLVLKGAISNSSDYPVSDSVTPQMPIQKVETKTQLSDKENTNDKVSSNTEKQEQNTYTMVMAYYYSLSKSTTNSNPKTTSTPNSNTETNTSSVITPSNLGISDAAYIYMMAMGLIK